MKIITKLLLVIALFPTYTAFAKSETLDVLGANHIQSSIDEAKYQNRMNAPERLSALIQRVQQVVEPLIDSTSESPIFLSGTHNYKNPSTLVEAESMVTNLGVVPDLVAEKILIGLIKTIDPTQAHISSNRIEDFNYIDNETPIMAILKNVSKKTTDRDKTQYFQRDQKYKHHIIFDSNRSHFLRLNILNPNGFEVEPFKIFVLSLLNTPPARFFSFPGIEKKIYVGNNLLILTYQNRPDLRPFLKYLTSLLFPLLNVQQYPFDPSSTVRKSAYFETQDIAWNFVSKVLNAALIIRVYGSNSEIEYLDQKLIQIQLVQKELLNKLEDPTYQTGIEMNMILERHNDDISDIDTLRQIIETRYAEHKSADIKKKEPVSGIEIIESEGLPGDSVESTRERFRRNKIVQTFLQEPVDYWPTIEVFFNFFRKRSDHWQAIQFELNQLFYSAATKNYSQQESEIYRAVYSIFRRWNFYQIPESSNVFFHFGKFELEVLSNMIVQERFTKYKSSPNRNSSIQFEGTLGTRTIENKINGVYLSDAPGNVGSKAKHCALSLHQDLP